MKPDPKVVLLDLYHSYITLARTRGLPISEFTDEQLADMSVFDLSTLIFELKALVRTPLPR